MLWLSDGEGREGQYNFQILMLDIYTLMLLRAREYGE